MQSIGPLPASLRLKTRVTSQTFVKLVIDNNLVSHTMEILKALEVHHHMSKETLK